MHGRARGKPEGFAGLPYRGRVATVRHGLRDVLQRLALTFGQLLDHCTSTFGLSPAIERLFASEYRAGYRHARTCVRFPALTRTYVRRSIEHAFDLGRGKLSHRLISVRPVVLEDEEPNNGDSRRTARSSESGPGRCAGGPGSPTPASPGSDAPATGPCLPG